jgi:hypothetical protein
VQIAVAPRAEQSASAEHSMAHTTPRGRALPQAEVSGIWVGQMAPPGRPAHSEEAVHRFEHTPQ